MKSKSTHRGHCQLCGAMQKLPNGVLSTHGYTVSHGYFSGICRGTKHLPYEQSIDLLVPELAMVDAALTRVEAEILKLRTEFTPETRMWITTFMPHGTFPGSKRSGNVWSQVELTASMTEPQADGWQTVSYSYIDKRGRECGDSRSGFYGVKPYDFPGEDVESLRKRTVLKYNNTFADWREHEAKSLRMYKSWLADRIKNFVADAPLFAIDSKDDKKAFVPVAPAYAALVVE